MDAESTSGFGCDCATAGGPQHDALRPRGRIRRWAGFSMIGVSCGLAWSSSLLSPWLWPLAAVVAWFGAYQTVYAKGCAVGGAGPGSGEAAGLGTAQRRSRARMGLGFLAAGVAAAGAAACDLSLLWPIAGIALWFGASFLVAAATGYSGCPEVGAIPSWLLRRDIPTRCPPLERVDASEARRNAFLAR